MTQMFTSDDIVAMLGRTIGHDKARSVVTEAIALLGFSSDALLRPEALALLEEISDQDGIVGISARFAKSRVHLLGVQL